MHFFLQVKCNVPQLAKASHSGDLAQKFTPDSQTATTDERDVQPQAAPG